ncbi:uncharacterized protein LOC124159624 [Ischnura elegans]|uniref:uncharacterized protein LOC124159624 n=1 Tax=Ischnura elegans TaxID=197161 RepID=UPI001ED8761B|nr:uncharacterized protein LOC124159624 [Ischnura elegans]
MVMISLIGRFRSLRGAAMYCHDTMDCFLLPGYTCQMGRCICDQERHTGLFSCIPARIHGDKCQDDLDCRTGDVNLVCVGLDQRTCRCRRGLLWDVISKRCYRVDDDIYGGKFDPIRDVIIPGIIVMTIGAMMYLGIKLFCNCGKLWHRRRRQDTTQEPHHHSGTTWVTSYRVVGSLSGLEGGAAAINGGATTNGRVHHHHQQHNGTRGQAAPLPPPTATAATACVGLFVGASSAAPSAPSPSPPSTSSLALLAPPPLDGPVPAPPPYEEALGHKVVLSSGYPLPPAAGPSTSRHA